MDIKNSRRFLLTTFAGGLAFFGITKVTKIFGVSFRKDETEGKLVIKPHKDAIYRQKGGKV